MFYRGFNRMHKYRLIKDIPRSKVRAIAMGLVEIHGSVKDDDVESCLKTPFSQTDCVYYRYEIKEYRRHTSRDSKGRTRTTYRWDTIASGERRMPFFAEDETGCVRVEPTGAEFSVAVKKAFLQKAGLFGGITSLISLLKNWDEGPAEALDVSNMNLVPVDPGAIFSFGSRVGDRKYFEYYLEPGENLFVMGTAAGDREAPNNVVIRKGENHPTFIISNKSEKDLLRSLKWQMIGCYAGGGAMLIIGVVVLLHFSGRF